MGTPSQNILLKAEGLSTIPSTQGYKVGKVNIIETLRPEVVTMLLRGRESERARHENVMALYTGICCHKVFIRHLLS